MNKMMSSTAMASCAVLLAGCATTGGGDRDPAVFAADAGSAMSALGSGETLHAYNSLMIASMEHDDNAGTSRVVDPASFALTQNAQGGMDATVNGQTISFVPADRHQFGWSKDNGNAFYGLNSWSGPNADAVLDPANPSYHQVWRYWYHPEGAIASSGYAVVGTEAMASALEGKANATYSGYARALIYDRSSFDSHTEVGGDVTLNADFSAGHIQGAITDLSVRPQDGDWSALAGQIALQRAAITGNGYSGTLGFSPALLDAVGTTQANGTYAGKFYGATASQAAGVLTFNGADSQGTGFFSTVQD